MRLREVDRAAASPLNSVSGDVQHRGRLRPSAWTRRRSAATSPSLATSSRMAVTSSPRTPATSASRCPPAPGFRSKPARSAGRSTPTSRSRCRAARAAGAIARCAGRPAAAAAHSRPHHLLRDDPHHEAVSFRDRSLVGDHDIQLSGFTTARRPAAPVLLRESLRISRKPKLSSPAALALLLLAEF